jgi:ADP-heptose:LPS heptosyltransferase
MLADGRILLIRLGSFGDLVFTLPAVHTVRMAFPQARITFLTYREYAPLLQGFGELETVLTLDRAGYKQLNPKVLLGDTPILLTRLLWRDFTLAVDFQGFGETAWLTWWSRAPQRWGSVYRPSRGWAYTRAVPRNTTLHPVDYNLDLLRQAGGLAPIASSRRFQVPDTAMDQARRWFDEHDLNPERPTLLLHPFSSSPHKNWPLDRYLAAAQRGRQSGLQILFSGGPAERAALEPARQAGFAVAAGAPLLVSAALAQLSTLVLGVDTGFLHLAVAMGKRVIMMMGSVQPGACYPFGHPEWALLPADGAPVASVPVGVVWQACVQALEEQRVTSQS